MPPSRWRLLLSAALALPGCGRVEAEGPDLPHVLVVTLDTLRADHLGCYGYFRDTSPRLDELARESMLFETCRPPVAQTLPTHASLFTGLAPYEHGILANAKSRRSYDRAPGAVPIAVAMGELGYDTAAYVAAEVLKEGFGLRPGFGRWWEPEVAEVRADEVVGRVLRDYPSRLAGPTFTWVHLFDAHRRYDPPEGYRDLFPGVETERQAAWLAELGVTEDPARLDTRVPSDGGSAAADHDLYDGEIRWIDDQLRVLFDGLEALGVWDSLVLVVTGDHGEGLWQHDRISHTHIWLESFHVPFLLRAPGLSPGSFEGAVETVDALPTAIGCDPALSMALADWTDRVRGRDVLAPGWEEVPHFGHFPANRRPLTYAWIEDGWRVIYTEDEVIGLYDLESDPHELRSLHEEDPGRAERMWRRGRQRLRQETARGALLGAGGSRELDPERRAALEELGYAVGGEDDDD